MRSHHTTVKLIVMFAVLIVVTVVAGFIGPWTLAPDIGWCCASAVYSIWVWAKIRNQNAMQTAEHASREDPNREIADLLIVLLSIASLFAVVVVLVEASSSHGLWKGVLATLAVLSVALSWIMLHTLYTLRYARLYYMADKGIDFNQKEAPQYTDFAYMAFVLGMTYQVSDTNLTNHVMRVTVLKHSLLSFVFGAVILATTINLIAGLSS